MKTGSFLVQSECRADEHSTLFKLGARKKKTPILQKVVITTNEFWISSDKFGKKINPNPLWGLRHERHRTSTQHKQKHEHQVRLYSNRNWKEMKLTLKAVSVALYYCITLFQTGMQPSDFLQD